MAKKNLSDFDKIIVLDFGSQYNQLITRRIRDFGIYSELLPHDLDIEKIKKIAPKGIIFSGGPNSVYDDGALKVDPEIFKLGIPILGICYGMQLMSYDLGGKVEKADNSEYGRADIEVTDPNAVMFSDLPEKQFVWMSHGDLVTKAPEGFKVTAKSKNCPISAIANDEKKFYGIQFHAEVRNSEYGLDILKNFAFKVCGAKANWTMDDFIDMKIDEIREEVGDKKVILGLSGGVDSSVTATLLHKAIGDQLTAIFVDHGMLRKDEGDQVMKALNKDLGVNIIRVNAQKRFLDKLKGVTDPEKKRKIIGKEFIEVFNEEAKKLKDVDFLAQGTLYTDVIESGTNTAQTIKSHHNVGGLPKDMHFKLIEPLRKLFKDEVRVLGEKLGIPHDLVWRQPFPGPGLGIRVLGEVTEDKLEIVRESDAILRDEIKKAGLQEKIWQYFTVLPGIRSVGVMGDGRTYDYTIGIRAVTSIDGMTADFAQIPWDVLGKISTRIVDECDHINRVVYDVTSKPPSTIEWE
ncbi:glutamine-hydrolyzing GMP synthase [Lactobacillus hamsteri]|uniref:GMP synthase [glutamine-hydrolyzing] n=1 Tax=Lactobacillus hamsteri DSM 5661 = JCM 6256 TaxID=1423754 RepID=A0A0R1YFQ9_9LACO|nr:glutamine-hydrolyzing GMP synthase [Lactobacillus hamsteri]KRM41039.1 bifunctional GMP synthase glutamine amidotransferase protein [Lactobacillus hamsteri DSM 5661 = JCM 6256]